MPHDRGLSQSFPFASIMKSGGGLMRAIYAQRRIGGRRWIAYSVGFIG